MKLRNRLKQIFACFALVIALVLSCSFQTIGLASSYIATAYAKVYEAEDKVDAYEFTTSSQWHQNTNYANQKDAEENSVNAFSGTNSSVDLSTLEKADKPTVLWDGTAITTPDPASQADEGEEDEKQDNYVMMITANDAEKKQWKDAKDEDNNVIYLDDTFVTDEHGAIKYYTASEINTSNIKYVPVDETADPEHAGMYKEKKAKQEEKDIYFYYRSNSIGLAKSSYYVVSLWVYTTGDATATLKMGTSDDKFSTTLPMHSVNAWKKYYLFIETRSDGSTPTIYLNIYFGNTESIAGTSDAAATKVTGSVYVDTVEVKTINQTDYNQKTINGVAPAESGHAIQSYSGRFNYDGLISNPNFDSALTYLAGNGFEGTNFDNADWKYYIPEYISGSTEDKLSQTTISKYKDVYTTYSTIKTVGEAGEIKVYDLDAEGNKQYDAADTEQENPLMKDGFSTFGLNNQILKIENKSQLYSIGIVSKPFTVNQFGYYRVSMWVKATSEDSNAEVVLFGKIPTGDKSEGLQILKSQTIGDLYVEETEDEDAEEKKDDTMDYNNGWKEVVFYVHGNAFRDTQIQLALLASKNSTVYYDTVRVESVLSTNYSSSSSSLRLELSPSAQTVSKSITNGYFDNIETEEYDYTKVKAPYKAQSWTLDKENSEDVTAGIVSTATAAYNAVKADIGNAVNPNGTENGIELAKNNVYVIYAPSTVEEETDVKHDYKFTSNSFSLSSGSVYRISFKVKVSSGTDADFSGKVVAYLTYSEKTIAEFKTTIDASSSKDVWQTYTFLVRTGTTSRSTTITLGVEDAQGTVFFKNVGYSEVKEVERTEDITGEKVKVSADEQFEELFTGNTTEADRLANNFAVVDYSSYNFTMHSAEKVTITEEGEDDEDDTVINKDYYESFSHKVVDTSTKDDTEAVNGITGVVDTSKDFKLNDTTTLLSSDISNPSSKTDTALLIYNQTDVYTTVSPNVTYTLAKESFYQVEIYVKTGGFTEGNGLDIKINEISVNFDNIDTTGETENNGYVKYTVLIRTGESAISGFSVDFVLGTKENKINGYALVSDINLTKLADLEAYEELTEAVAESDKNTVIKSFYVETDTNDDDDPTTTDTLTTFFLVFSSILMIVALVIALVAIAIKKHPRKKKVVVLEEETSNYKQNKVNRQAKDTEEGGFVE